MSEKRRKIKYWILKVLSVLISCGLPIYAVWDHFPIWTENHGTVRSIGAGGIICLIVLVVIFRKAVFNFLKDKAKLNHAPPIVVWLVMLIISYILIYISNFIQDLTTVVWMGLVGCAIGTMLTYIAENNYGKKEADTNGGA
jgi:O-antigen ligase